MVSVVNGVNSLNSELEGKSVSQVRTSLRQALNIDPAAKAYVNDNEVNSSYVLEEGDHLEFMKQSGQKG